MTMNVRDLALLLAEGFFPLLAVLTLINLIRHRDWVQLDIVLMFAALSVTGISQMLINLAGLSPLWLDKLSWIGLIVQPIFCSVSYGTFARFLAPSHTWRWVGYSRPRC